MPRKAGSRKHKEVVTDEINPDVDSAPRRSGRASTKPETASQEEPERSRRSSTVAQTAESRSSRKRHRNLSPSDHSGEKEVNIESHALRVRLTRRSTGRVNYKESDDEGASTPKNEDNFDSNDEYEESDSDERGKPKTKKVGQTASRGKGRPKGKTSSTRTSGRGRGRPIKKKYKDEEEEEFSEENLDETSEEENVEKDKSDDDEVEEVTSKSGRKRLRVASFQETAGKAGRRKGAKATATIKEPAVKRPSRNKQVKKYVEVDEDSGESKSGNAEVDDDDDDVIEESKDKKEDSKAEKTDRSDDDVKEIASVPGRRRSRGQQESTSNKPSRSARSSGKEPISTRPSRNKQVKYTEIDEGSSEEKEESEGKSEKENSKKRKRDPKSDTEKDTRGKRKKLNNNTEETINLDEDEEEAGKTFSKDETKLEKDPAEKNSENEEKLSSEDPMEIDEEESDSSKTMKEQPKEMEPNKPSSKVLELRLHKIKDGETKDLPKSELEASDSNLDNDDLKTEKASEGVANAGDQENTEVPKTVRNVAGTKQDKHTFPSRETEKNVSLNGDDKIPGNSVPATDKPCKSNELRGDEPLYAFPNRQYISNSSLSEDSCHALKEKMFGWASYNLNSLTIPKEKFVQDLAKLQASIICLQGVPKPLFYEYLESSLDVQGFKAVVSFSESEKGLVTFYKASVFQFSNKKELSLQKILEEEAGISVLEEKEKSAIQEVLKKCGNVLFTELEPLFGDPAIYVANIQIPGCSDALNTLQMLCLNRRIAAEKSRSAIVCGEFNFSEGQHSYDLMRLGNISDDQLKTLRTEFENSVGCISLAKMLQKLSQNPSCIFQSCYASVLGKELLVPETKADSRDLMWVSAGSFHTVGVLGISADDSRNLNSDHISLKADIAFSE